MSLRAADFQGVNGFVETSTAVVIKLRAHKNLGILPVNIKLGAAATWGFWEERGNRESRPAESLYAYSRLFLAGL